MKIDLEELIFINCISILKFKIEIFSIMLKNDKSPTHSHPQMSHENIFSCTFHTLSGDSVPSADTQSHPFSLMKYKVYVSLVKGVIDSILRC